MFEEELDVEGDFAHGANGLSDLTNLIALLRTIAVHLGTAENRSGTLKGARTYTATTTSPTARILTPQEPRRSTAVRGTGKFLLHAAVFPTWRAEKCWTDESSADSDLQVNEKAACTDTAALARATKTAFACRLPQTPYRRYGARVRDKGRMPVRRLRAEPNPVGSRGAPDRATAGPLPLGAQVKMALAEVWPKLPEKA